MTTPTTKTPITAQTMCDEIQKLVDGFAGMYPLFPASEKEALRKRLVFEIMGKIKEWLVEVEEEKKKE